jgi:putative NIF3 family GTP cyclohydrolase 1 type 2
MATIEVLNQAVKAGANFIITAEPTFYSRGDSPQPAARRGGPGAGPAREGAPAAMPSAPSDPVFTGKNDLIKKHGLVIWRFSDHWRLREPDPLAQGLSEALGWSKLTTNSDPARVTIPAISLDALAADVKKKLHLRGGARVVGDPKLSVRRIGLLPGTTPIRAALQMLPDVDLIIAGEVREWESVEYALDKVTAGEKKALMTIGRVVSEDPSMNLCAAWIKTLVPEVPVKWITAGDPYWRPA